MAKKASKTNQEQETGPTPAVRKGNDGLRPEEVVRQQVIANLRKLAWSEAQLRWRPEWQVPASPHDLTKRERGQKYKTLGSCDLVAFADER